MIEARERICHDAEAAVRGADQRSPAPADSTTTSYADAVATYLAMAISRLADYGSSIATWRPKDNAMRSTMPKQGIQMTWDFAEGSPFGASSSGFAECVEVIIKVLVTALSSGNGHARQANVQDVQLGSSGVAMISTDPPYYDNIGYSDLSDFFYVCLRPSLREIYPELFSTLAAPKSEELVAVPHRHGTKKAAETFFLDGMTSAMVRLAGQSHTAFPMTVYYAFKQSEARPGAGIASTGWETFLDAIVRTRLMVTGTWPMRTEGDNRQVGIGSNALASSIVLVCRPRPDGARRPRVASSLPNSNWSCPPRYGTCSTATLPRSTSRRRPLVPAWLSSHDTRTCSTLRANR